MAFSDDDIRKVAHLARLELTDQEVQRLGPQLERILGFVEQLAELNTDEVEPMTTALDVSNRWMADEPAPSLSREAALANAPLADDECFLVPPVLPPS
ncbi:Glutamyl-tRNA(Gln) amidotransferase subunit C [Roseimaritima multifibrata]|uniref:Aspartyl/glutamyl-tRNA(Asn/Gln) amidotransferase subunit C n=1 Tax=Roseimaritima multifibrata TaxID=1930274 RepID=A0A517MDQ7_9BACT|nr:Asp-tRNA(Asn)/Glu-tRNA(Gln) amidotransferase subunit GatC [Roseimaritima multifibrata]QDS93019.1 Glutamyl-tRNA(Gln) amidotransferase subunit C [Roseimaritima multifibrata]